MTCIVVERIIDPASFRTGGSEMTPERWRRAKAIFQSALDLPEAERAAFVAEASADDAEVRSEVESLLDEYAREDGFSLGTENLPLSPNRDAEATLPMQLAEDPVGLVGTTLDETYRIVRLLGRGGMGVVYLAEHALLNDRVAVKLLPAAGAARADAFQRFLREGRLARAIHHPNVVAVYEMRTSSDGLPYMVMEYVEGPTLRDEMRRRGPIPLDEALGLLEPIAAALDHAHGLGIVHRDLKPENVIIGTASGEPVVKLLDLGIARLFDASDDGPPVTNVTSAGQIIGTPAYMPPEQWGQLPEDGGSEIDARVDVYGLGVMLFEMVAGRTPFAGATPYDLRVAHIRETPPALADLAPAVSRGASAAVARALSKDRSDRQASAGELLAQARTGAARPAARRAGRTRRATTNTLMALGALVVGAVVLGMVVSILVGLGVAGKLGAPSVEPASTPAAAEREDRTLKLSVLARRVRDGKPEIAPFGASEDATFADGDGLRVEASCSHEGYLYVINEAPTLDPETGLPRYTVVFPKPGAGGESARMLANDVMRIPGRTWIRFFGSGGRETLWVIWSAQPVGTFRDFERLVTPERLGRVTDHETAGAINTYLARAAGDTELSVTSDGKLGRNSITTSGDVIAFPLYFDHR